jgi:hypothetical protein
MMAKTDRKFHWRTVKHKERKVCWAWWYKPVIPALGRLRQENWKSSQA